MFDSSMLWYNIVFIENIMLGVGVGGGQVSMPGGPALQNVGLKSKAPEKQSMHISQGIVPKP